MNSNATLQDLARQVRGGTLEILIASKPRWLTYSPPGTSNHMLWHAGHALWLQDALCIELLTGNSELPNQWAETFGMNCRPVSHTGTWPSRDEMVDRLQRQLDRILTVLSQASDQQLAAPADRSRGPDSISSRIIHGLHDEAKHAGEMYLLFKLARNKI